MNVRVKHIFIAVLDIVLACYLFLAVTSFNKPKTADLTCSKVEINVADSSDSGFLSAAEIKALLKNKGLYPLGKKMDEINPRSLEEAMSGNNGLPFVKTAECYKTTNGHVCITITQRTPLIRVKNANGDDYYLDDHGGTMPNSKYTSDLIIATGSFNNAYARFYITPMARAIMASDFWRNQIEQINILPDHGVELVPRVGNHIIYIGHLPVAHYKWQANKFVSEYVKSKLDRTLKFYKYGLSKAGWNKYSYIDVELDNQIVCRRRDKAEEAAEPEAEEAKAAEAGQQEEIEAEPSDSDKKESNKKEDNNRTKNSI